MGPHFKFCKGFRCDCVVGVWHYRWSEVERFWYWWAITMIYTKDLRFEWFFAKSALKVKILIVRLLRECCGWKWVFNFWWQRFLCSAVELLSLRWHFQNQGMGAFLKDKGTFLRLKYLFKDFGVTFSLSQSAFYWSHFKFKGNFLRSP